LVGSKIDVQHAKQFMLDTISIVFEWNERFVSDKEAMNKIVQSLLKGDNDKNELAYKKTTKKSASIIAMISGLCVFLFVFVSFGDFTNAESILQMENEKLMFEQLYESSSETKGKILNNTKEEFSNQISLRLD
jgi:hypothetical protein